MDLGGNIPAFLLKLWKMVEDPETNHMICWGEEGKSFIIVDPIKVLKIMQKFYKHGNMASFVRQLNMYGFRKVSNLDNGLNSINIMEYVHPYFVKDFPNLMENISRRNAPQVKKLSSSSHPDVNVVMSQLQEASSNQEALASQLELMRTKHVQLVNELGALRKAVLNKLDSDSGARQRLSDSTKPSSATTIHNLVTDEQALGGIGDVATEEAVTSVGLELGQLLAEEARARLQLVNLQRKSLLREHWLRMRELELRVSAEKVRAERETTEWSLRMKSRDQKLANLRMCNEILREELRSLHC